MQAAAQWKQDGRHVDVWVKPGTLPEKYITMIEESMAEAAKE